MTSTLTHSKRRIAVAAAVAAAIALAAAILLSGGSSSGGGLGPAAALAQAADGTAAVTSGVVTTAASLSGGESTLMVLRFDGDDVEAQFDDPATGTRRTIRVVGGSGFEKAADGTWSALEGDGQTTAVAQVKAEIANRTLVDLVRSADGVTQDGDVYRAKLSGEQVAGLADDPLGIGSAPPADGVDVEVTVGTDGLLRKVSVAAGGLSRTVTYSQLGEPQDLAAPDLG